MPLLQVRNFPDDLYKKLAMTAKKKNRTISQQTVVMLEQGLGQQQSNIERRSHLLEKIKTRNTSEKAKRLDAVSMVREDRER